MFVSHNQKFIFCYDIYIFSFDKRSYVSGIFSGKRINERVTFGFTVNILKTPFLRYLIVTCVSI